MNSLTLKPVAKISGDIKIPGSKSLSNRILLLAALAQGDTHITNLLDSDDIGYMLTALNQLGVSIDLSADKTSSVVHGLGHSLGGTENELFLGNAGTAMRPLTAVLSAGKGAYTLTGEPRMYERPIDDLVDALKTLGCDIRYLAARGYPPLRINAHGINGSRVEIRGNISSQFLTALLMAAPLANGNLEIVVKGELVSKPYIDITLDVMNTFGVQVDNDNYQKFQIDGQQIYQSPRNVMVEGDASSASYFLAAAAIAGGTVEVTGVGSDSVQGDKLFADVLTAMGARIEYKPHSIAATYAGPLKAIDMDLNHIPDAAMTIATTALFAQGTTVIRNIYNWRVKETDRLAAMATELRKLGAAVDEGRDYLAITPPENIRTAAIDTYNDHRIAMCFSLVCLSDSAVTINDPTCVNKTFPEYFELFKSICH